MPQIPQQRNYQSPPGSGINDGALPQVFDTTWQGYTNLSAAQVAAFQAFPQDLLAYVSLRRWLAEESGITALGVPITTRASDQDKISQLKQGFDTGAITGTVSFSDAAGNTQTVNAAAATAIYTAVVQFVQSTYTAMANLKAGIKATPPTITKRSQIDAALAAIAPNSPSATNPGVP